MCARGRRRGAGGSSCRLAARGKAAGGVAASPSLSVVTMAAWHCNLTITHLNRRCNGTSRTLSSLSLLSLLQGEPVYLMAGMALWRMQNCKTVVSISLFTALGWCPLLFQRITMPEYYMNQVACKPKLSTLLSVWDQTGERHS